MKRFPKRAASLLYYFCIALGVSACGETAKAPSATKRVTTETITYTSAHCVAANLTYSVTIPAQWRSVASAGCDVQFQDTAVVRPNIVTTDEATESEFFVAGIGIRGRIAVASDEADGIAWLSIQPNHSSVVEWQPIDTPIGSGRGYTLDRDRVASTWSTADPTWRGQYAYIPRGDISYEVWIRVGKNMQGKIDPTLSQMLNSLTVR